LVKATGKAGIDECLAAERLELEEEFGSGCSTWSISKGLSPEEGGAGEFGIGRYSVRFDQAPPSAI
jgi:hypothetical protein